MDIRTHSYKLCKSVWKSDHRERIKELINGINFVSPTKRGSVDDRSHYGYEARKLHSQVFGYLIIDQLLETDRRRVFHSSQSRTLNDDERKLLIGAHKQIHNLGLRCFDPVINKYPKYLEAIDPYLKYRYTGSDNGDEVSLYDQELSESLVQKFNKHIAIQIFFQTVELVEKYFSPEILVKASIDMEKSLQKSGVDKFPENLTRILFNSQSNDPARLATIFISSLFCLRASLSILNELIFQAILTNKLPLLSEDNVISYQYFSHVGGNGLILLAQPDKHFVLPEFGLALMKDQKIEGGINLINIESFRVNFSKEFGETFEIHARQVDENLNPYSSILQFR